MVSAFSRSESAGSPPQPYLVFLLGHAALIFERRGGESGRRAARASRMFATAVITSVMVSAFQAGLGASTQVARRHDPVSATSDVIVVVEMFAMFELSGASVLAYGMLCESQCGNDMELAQLRLTQWLAKDDYAQKETAMALYTQWENHPVDELYLVAQRVTQGFEELQGYCIKNPKNVTIVSMCTLCGMGTLCWSTGLSVEAVGMLVVVVGMAGYSVAGGVTMLCAAQRGNDKEKAVAYYGAYNEGKGDEWKAQAEFHIAKWENTFLDKLRLVPSELRREKLGGASTLNNVNRAESDKENERNNRNKRNFFKVFKVFKVFEVFKGPPSG